MSSVRYGTRTDHAGLRDWGRVDRVQNTIACMIGLAPFLLTAVEFVTWFVVWQSRWRSWSIAKVSSL